MVLDCPWVDQTQPKCLVVQCTMVSIIDAANSTHYSQNASMSVGDDLTESKLVELMGVGLLALGVFSICLLAAVLVVRQLYFPRGLQTPRILESLSP